MSEIFQKIYDCLNGEFPKNINSIDNLAQLDSYNILHFNKDVPIDTRAIHYPFELDEFQKKAIYRISRNENVFIAAHTSSGKTIAAEYAIAQSLKQGCNAIYTSPIKALSNQKYRDFRELFSNKKFNTNDDPNIGIITGDVQMNQDAKCLVMTTEILRNMIYKMNPYLNNVNWIIFDEIHYMNDNERGRVWEEIIQMAPKHISMIFLSATTPNALQFSNWVASIRNRPVYISQTLKRPIPIEHYINIGNTEQSINQYYEEIIEKKKIINDNVKVKKKNETGELITMNQEYIKINKTTKIKDSISTVLSCKDNCFKIVDKNVQFMKNNMKIATEQLTNKLTRTVKHKSKKTIDQFNKRVCYKTKINNMINLFKLLQLKDKLPVIVFAFSRKGCENFCNQLQCLDFLHKKNKHTTKQFINDCLTIINKTDRELPQIKYVTDLLLRGIGIHHSGLLPILKEIVEILFQNGTIKILFATETFAMGVNMPAKTVVFSSLKKHDGQQFRYLLPGEYIQMAGRAGRRGFDDVGTVIILAYNGIPDNLQKIVMGKPLTLESKYYLTYQTILTILQLGQHNEDLSVSHLLRCSYGEHAITMSLSQIDYSKNILFDSKKIYKKLVQLSSLQLTQIKKLDDFYESMESLIPFMESIHENTFLTLYLGAKKRKKLLSNQRIIVVTPEGNKLFPELMVVIEYNDLSMECIYLQDYIKMKNTIQEEQVLTDTVSIYYKWIIGITTSCLSNYESISKLNLIGKKQLLISKKIDNVRYNDNKSKLDTLFKQNCSIGFPINEFEFKLCQQRVKLRYLIQDLHYSISDKTLQLMPNYEKKKSVLLKLNYINDINHLLLKGKIAKEINTCNELLLTECIMDGIFQNLPLSILTSLLSMFVTQCKSKMIITINDIAKINSLMADKIEYIEKHILNNVINTQLTQGIDIDKLNFKEKNFNNSMVLVVYQWCEGKSFSDICKITDIMEGTIIRILLRLIETLLEIKKIAIIIENKLLEEQMELCVLLIKRDIVFTESLYL